MRLIINQKQMNILAESQVTYSEEKVHEFINKGRMFLDKGVKARDNISNLLLSTTLDEVTNDSAKYKELDERCKSLSQTAYNLAEQLYKIVEMYDIMDRPESVATLEYKIYGPVEDLKENFDDLSEIIDALLTSASDMKRILA